VVMKLDFRPHAADHGDCSQCYVDAATHPILHPIEHKISIKPNRFVCVKPETVSRAMRLPALRYGRTCFWLELALSVIRSISVKPPKGDESEHWLEVVAVAFIHASG
jgi:hypothetical protein